MHITEEEQRDKKDIIAITASALIMAIVILLLIFGKIRTPIPAFPETITPMELEIAGGSDFGNYVEGQGNSESNGMGDGQGDKQSTTPPMNSGQPQDDSYLGNPAEDPSPIKGSENPSDGRPSTNQQKPDDELSAALNAFSNSKPGEGGGDGQSGRPGNEGTPKGTGGEGTGLGPGKGTGISLKGRSIVRWPDRVNDSKEEGKVVVGIVVDEKGNVIKAEPGEAGSTTTSAYLYMLARQAAMTAKFSPSPEGAEEQYGTITFVFVLQ